MMWFISQLICEFTEFKRRLKIIKERSHNELHINSILFFKQRNHSKVHKIQRIKTEEIKAEEKRIKVIENRGG